MLHPIIPEFFWATAEGKQLQQEIKLNLQRNLKPKLRDFKSTRPSFFWIKDELRQTIDHNHIYRDEAARNRVSGELSSSEVNSDPIVRQKLGQLLQHHGKAEAKRAHKHQRSGSGQASTGPRTRADELLAISSDQ